MYRTHPSPTRAVPNYNHYNIIQSRTYLVDAEKVINDAAVEVDVTRLAHGVGQHLSQLLCDHARVLQLCGCLARQIGVLVVVAVLVDLQARDVLQLSSRVQLTHTKQTSCHQQQSN